MTKDSLVKIGINACIDKLGREFVKKYSLSSTSAYGDTGDGVFCYVGVNDQEENIWESPEVVLDSITHFPYKASCIVKENGEIVFRECVLPTDQ